MEWERLSRFLPRKSEIKLEGSSSFARVRVLQQHHINSHLKLFHVEKTLLTGRDFTSEKFNLKTVRTLSFTKRRL